MIKNLTIKILLILLPIFFVIPQITQAQTTQTFTIPNQNYFTSIAGSATSYGTAYATTTGILFKAQAGHSTHFQGIYYLNPVQPYATTTVTFTVDEFSRASTADCTLAVGYIDALPTTFSWSPSLLMQDRTTLNVSATGTYSITDTNDGSGAVAVGFMMSSNQNSQSRCSLLITDFTIDGVDVYNIITIPVTFGGGGGSSMGTTTIASSSVTDSALFLLGIIASALIFLLLVRIIWKP